MARARVDAALDGDTALTDDERALIRQCWLYAAFRSEETHYAVYSGATVPGRPYWQIELALLGCGYAPSGRDWRLWNVVKRSGYDFYRYRTKKATP